jgi:hypothetical protein
MSSSATTARVNRIFLNMAISFRKSLLLDLRPSLWLCKKKADFYPISRSLKNDSVSRTTNLILALYNKFLLELNCTKSAKTKQQ